MLPAKCSLKSKSDFNALFRRGKSLSNDVLVMKYEKCADGGVKVGFSVGVKFSKKAIERNKAKRWMREAARMMIKEIRPGFQIIFLINSKFPFEQMSFILVEKKIRDLLGKAKLLR